MNHSGRLGILLFAMLFSTGCPEEPPPPPKPEPEAEQPETKPPEPEPEKAEPAAAADSVPEPPIRAERQDSAQSPPHRPDPLTDPSTRDAATPTSSESASTSSPLDSSPSSSDPFASGRSQAAGSGIPNGSSAPVGAVPATQPAGAGSSGSSLGSSSEGAAPAAGFPQMPKRSATSKSAVAAMKQARSLLSQARAKAADGDHRGAFLCARDGWVLVNEIEGPTAQKLANQLRSTLLKCTEELSADANPGRSTRERPIKLK